MSRTRVILPAIVLTVWGAAVFQRCLDAPFIFDDHGSIRDNPHIRRLWPLTDAMSAPPHETVSQRPVASLSLAINYAIGRLDVRGYHAMNIAIHVCAALLLFGVVRRTLASQLMAAKWGGWSTPLAFAISLLWMVHPLQTEAVAYTVQRTELLMSFFCLATLYLAIRSWQAETHATTWMACAVIACVLGMASKQNMAGCPLIVLLWDRAFFSRSLSAAIRRGRELYAGLVATWGVLLWLVLTDTREGSVGYDLIGPWDYLKTQTTVIVHYLRLCVRPWPLSIAYHWPWAWSLRDCLPEAAMVLAMAGATVYGVIRNRWWGVAGAAFFLILAPTSSVLPVITEPIAERRMHLPLAAVIAVVILVIVGSMRQTRGRRVALLVLTIALAVPLSWLSLHRLADYDSALSIWSAAADAYPNHPPNQLNLGAQLAARGELDTAMQRYRKAIELNPKYAQALIAMGALHLRRHEVDAARLAFEQAIDINPRDARAWAGMTDVLRLSGDMTGAIDAMSRALENATRKGVYLNNLGMLHAEAGDAAAALEAFMRAVAADPLTAEYRLNAATALDALGRHDEAIVVYGQAIARDPKYAAAYENIVALLTRLNKDTEAHGWCKTAFDMGVETAQLRNGYGGLLARSGRIDEAIVEFEKALAIDPDYAAAQRNLEKARAIAH